MRFKKQRTITKLHILTLTKQMQLYLEKFYWIYFDNNDMFVKEEKFVIIHLSSSLEKLCI